MDKKASPLYLYILFKFLFLVMFILMYNKLLINHLEAMQFPKQETNGTLPLSYKSLSYIRTEINRLKTQYPRLVHLERIGSSTTHNLPIWGIRVSYNAAKREDEPKILFMGVHHAREPIGANICLELIRRLCAGYETDKKITKWLDSMEIWFVPIVNPEGYKYIFENNLGFPWWRKNMRDNDGDGRFNPLVDGVDLNRNYEFNWNQGGERKSTSWFFRGKKPFSEKETQAIRDLAIRENFVMGISYHSYGESILFPWGNYERPPDLDIIVDIASKMANRIGRESGYGSYSILPLNGMVGQSSIWMYGELRIIDYIVEVGTEYFPSDYQVPQIINENVKGAYFLLDRLLGSGIKGHVFDLHSREPLEAEIKIKGYSHSHVKPRKSEPVNGSFYRLLNPGTYTIEITCDGYYANYIENVKIRDNICEEYDVGLLRKNGYTN